MISRIWFLNCEYYDLSEKQSLDISNRKLSKPISRSSYYNYKKKLYHHEKFQSLKQSIYKSKLLKPILLYMDEPDESDSFNINKQISERFPNVDNIFNVTEEQKDRISKLITESNLIFVFQT
jgi:hypothetical protein